MIIVYSVYGFCDIVGIIIMSFSVLETRVVRNQSRLIFKSLGKCCPGKQFLNTCVII